MKQRIKLFFIKLVTLTGAMIYLTFEVVGNGLQKYLVYLIILYLILVFVPEIIMFLMNYCKKLKRK